jgi:Zn-dependent protease/predicted transcriptional regulator
MARSYGISTRSITLFALGGVASIEGEAHDAKAEFWIGSIGPISSAVMGLGSLGIAYLLGWKPPASSGRPVVEMLVWLGVINLGLAAFNMVPGFPLDGGRILRAIIWWITDDQDRSTRIAARIGQGIAVCFIILGLLRFFGGQGFGGLWIAFIGWFLLQAAAASFATVNLSSSLRNIQVKDLMTRDCSTVDGRTNLQNFVENHLLRTGRRCFIVEEDNRILGLITPNEVSSVERNKWPYTTIDEVMRPLEDLHTVSPNTPILEALETMGRDDVNQLPVVVDNHLEGIITRGNVVQFLQTRSELGR